MTKIVKTKLAAPTRKLSSAYTAEVSQQIEHTLSEELQKAIDDEIIHELARPYFVHQGWRMVMIESLNVTIDTWVEDNIQGQYRCYGYYWYFEREEDAVMFTLRWA